MMPAGCVHHDQARAQRGPTLLTRGLPGGVLQLLLLIRQMEATATQALAAKVSLMAIGHQAIMDAYLCLLHLTTGASPPSPHRPSGCSLRLASLHLALTYDCL